MPPELDLTPPPKSRGWQPIRPTRFQAAIGLSGLHSNSEQAITRLGESRRYKPGDTLLAAGCLFLNGRYVVDDAENPRPGGQMYALTGADAVEA